MNLLRIAALAILVLFEKLVPIGRLVQIRPAMSAFDPLQTSALEICCSVNRLPKPFVGWSVGNFNPVARCQPCSSGWCATEQPE